jgi:hypothetical protein
MIRKSIAKFLLLLFSAGNACAGVSKLEALSMIESGDNDSAIGRAGEVSRYQIKPWIWRRYSKTASYHNSQVSRAVAERYLAELEETFRKRTGREPDDFDIYILWNAGPTYYGKAGFSKNRVHRIIRERAQRYVNLREKRAEPVAEPMRQIPSISAVGVFDARGPDEGKVESLQDAGRGTQTSEFRHSRTSSQELVSTTHLPPGR